MAETSVIKGFLVSLGFKTDETALSNFTQGIERASKSVLGLAAVVEATALTVAIGVARFTSNLESLYFAAKRVGGTAAEMKALETMGRNMGAGANAMTGAVEALAQFVRTHPKGAAAAVLGIPISTDAEGNMLNGPETMLRLGEHLESLHNRALAYHMAGAAGIDDQSAYYMMAPDARQQWNHALKAQGSAAAINAAADNAHRLQVLIQDLQLQVYRMEVGIYNSVSTAINKAVGDLTRWLEKNAPHIQEDLVAFGTALLRLQQIMTPAFLWLIQQFKDLDAATDGWSTKIMVALAALKFFGVGQIVGALAQLALAFVSFGATAGPILTLIIAAGAAYELLNKSSWFNKFGEDLRNTPMNVRKHNPGALLAAGQPGTIGPHGNFVADFDTDEHGAAALANQLDLIVGRGARTVEQIAKAYEGSNYKPSYATGMAKTMGVGKDARLNVFNDPQVWYDLMRAITIEEGGKLSMVNPAIHLDRGPVLATAALAGFNRARGEATFRQTNHITVTGTGNKDMVDKIGKVIERANAGMARAFTATAK